MPSAFIIRPFGIRKGIDFERVERELIEPALAGFQFAGRTTGDTLRQGDIRTEMFQRLLTADLVVVDISIDNAKVFYELGIRHALCNKRTFLIRASSAELPADEVPFDLKADRYLSYDSANPRTALARLTEGLRQTLLSRDKDSPVFRLLPDLYEQDESHFLAVPEDFQEEVERAAAQEKPLYQWGDLKLLQTEAEGLQWEVEGLRLVGRAQLRTKAYEYARDTWEAVRRNAPDDKEANKSLGTIYEKLGDLTESSVALGRLLASEDTTGEERAEACSLIGNNLKEKWKATWTRLPVEQRRVAALRSPFLRQSYGEYRRGFIEDLNHYRSGIDALGLLTTIKELAASLPDVWRESFEDEADAERELKKVSDELAKLSNTVTLSLEAAKARTARASEPDIRFSIALADLACLTSKRPDYVADKYLKALTGARDCEIDAVRTQLGIYEQLAVLRENAAASLQAIPAPDVAEEKPPHVLLFVGHMIDAPTREKPRFPADREKAARLAIRDAVRREAERAGGELRGIAGAASGGDLIFHEVCAEFNIPSILYLALPREEYVRESVMVAGTQWVERFDALYKRLPYRVLADSKELPRWLQSKDGYNLWQRNNLWMLYNALSRGSRYMTLIALWDGRAGDGSGGTEDMVDRADERGAKTIILRTKEIFGL